MLKKLFSAIAVVAVGVMMSADLAMAEMVEMRSKPWQLFFQEPMSPTAEKVYDFNVFLLWVEGLITIFVLGLMAYICIKFNAKATALREKIVLNHLYAVM